MIAISKKYKSVSIPIVIACGGLLIMLSIIFYAFIYGDFFKEGAALVDMTWGMVTLVDLYLGLLLFSFWIMWREDNKVVAFAWSLLVLLLGNMLSCVYIIKAVYDAEGNITKFWLGERTTVK